MARRRVGPESGLPGAPLAPAGSEEFSAEQSSLQPPEDATDVVSVIRGVIEAEAGAIEHYNRIIEATDGIDRVTMDMAGEILRDEEGHLRRFERFLRELRARRVVQRGLGGCGTNGVRCA